MSAFALSVASYAQTSTFNEGDLVFNAGIGLGSTLYSGTGYNSTLPAISISGEYGVKEDFITDDLTLGLGGYIGIAGSKFEASYPTFGGTRTYGYKYNYTIIGARGTVHYPFVDKLDTYAGVMLGYNIVTVKETGDFPAGFDNASASSVAISAYIGGRYYFTDNFAAMAELGYGIAWLNIGVALKL